MRTPASGVDTTLVSAHDSFGRPRTHARKVRGAALPLLIKPRIALNPNSSMPPVAAWLSWPLGSAADGARELLSLSDSSRVAKPRSAPPLLQGACVAACGSMSQANPCLRRGRALATAQARRAPQRGSFL